MKYRSTVLNKKEILPPATTGATLEGTAVNGGDGQRPALLHLPGTGNLERLRSQQQDGGANGWELGKRGEAGQGVNFLGLNGAFSLRRQKERGGVQRWTRELA